MTFSEERFLPLVAFLAAVVIVAYFVDMAGAAFRPLAMLAVGVAAAAAAWRLVRSGAAVGDRQAATSGRGGRWPETTVGVGILLGMGGWLVWLSRPALLPLSSGPDLTHHLILIHYIEQHWRLVHDPSLERFLGEMMQYTPGSQILAALAGAWSGTDGLRALHPLLSMVVAVTAVVLWLVALRVLPPRAPRPLAAIAVLLLLAAPRYFTGPFTEFGFVAQVVAGLFAVAMWWAAVAWDQHPDWRLCVLFTLAAAAAFLTWPVYSGAPALAMGVVVLARTGLPLSTRIRHLAIAMGPLGGVAGAYIAGRLGWLQLAGTGGLAAAPSVDAYSWPLVVLASGGLAICLWRRRGRATALFTLAVLAEAASFYAIARHAGAPQPYMALKMFYLLLWPMTALATAAIGGVWVAIGRLVQRLESGSPVRQAAGRETIAAWTAVAVAAVLVARPLIEAPRLLRPVPPAVTLPLYRAGQWARANLPPACIEYLVGDDETAYWLHLAVLGNPRMWGRTGDNATYDPDGAILRWLTPGGLPYGIADLPALPASVRGQLQIVQQFGTAAIVRRRGASSCSEPG